MDLLEKFKTGIREKNLFSVKDRLILAVSGGIDSVVLCELCKQAGYDFRIAHCNFQLRGAESERDEEFVRRLGEKYGVEVFVKKFDTGSFAEEKKLSTQEAARELRYSWFAQLVKDLVGQHPVPRLPAGQQVGPLPIHVLTAHHADDNIETVLMNFFRGTGLHGLTGIPVSGVSAVLRFIKRPLLPFFKEELQAFATAHRLDYMEDSSNLTSAYTRNFFRNEIIPAIEKVYPQVKENLADNTRRFGEIEKLYDHAVGELKKKLCRQYGTDVRVPVKQLLSYNNRALVYAVISPYGFTEKQVEEVIRLGGSDSGKYILSPDGLHRVIKHRHWLIIGPAESGDAGMITIDETGTETRFAGGLIRMTRSGSTEPAASPFTACLDAQDIRFPLVLRRWKTGDYFYPLGMRKKKKLSRFFIDQKLSLPEKERVWVLESDKRIIWVAGYRIDDRFKITGKTQKMLRFELEKKGPA